jgi:hypothetical protein
MTMVELRAERCYNEVVILRIRLILEAVDGPTPVPRLSCIAHF